MQRRRRLLFWASLPIFIALAVFVFRDSLLYAIGAALVVQDQAEPSDIIFLLNGDVPWRALEAANLLHQGLAKKIAVARTPSLPPPYANFTDFAVLALKQYGVNDSQIVQLPTPGGVRHTADEADVLLDYCRKNGVHRVLAVTSELHARRARFILRKTLRPLGVRIGLVPAPYGPYRASNWWMSEDGLVVCEEEYVKLVYYHLRY